MFPELKRLIEQMGKDRGIDKSVIIEALEAAMVSAARKKLGARAEVEAHYNDEEGEIEVFLFKTVTDKVTDPLTQVSLEEARQMDEEAEIGDSLGMKIDTTTLGRIAVQTAKQIITQRIRDAERDVIYEEYKDRKGDIVTGFVHRLDGGNIIVSLGMAEGIVPVSEQIPRESYRRGDRIRAYVLDVKKNTKGPQIILSRTHPGFLKALFEIEVPEISEGLIEIVNVAREPGRRSKIAVLSRDRDIDPVGACVGVRGARVQSVVQELKGEKIDIVPYSEDPAKFICAALSPAKAERVYIDEENKAMEVIVPDDQLSLAIGKNGQNVRLAVRLTGWKIDVKSESAVKSPEGGEKMLMAIPGMTESLAKLLFGKGLKSVAMIAAADVSMIVESTGIDAAKAKELIDGAAQLLDEVTSKA
ncbi:MAG TPA: transcription termination factor NusA [Syntrophales bacterium]|nr:transcription termination factor NusA [Syntrophales bacterium]HOL59874.1 transcription termination factor NusA [Syntrophales bacterium]HPO36021.1 transcription termination factor NusA [Syntrophales bacterium]